MMKRVVAALEKLSIAYMVVGAYASNLYGRPRSTADGDFLVTMEDTKLLELVNELGEDFSLDPQTSFEALTMTPYRAIVHRGSAFRIEFFFLGGDPHHQAEFQRRRQVDFEGQPTSFPAAEDVVIQKLRWSQYSGRGHDLEDARQVVAAQGSLLDLEYLRRWTDLHGTRELLEQLLAELT